MMDMEIWQSLLLAGVGCIAGFLNVIAGGGSLLTMPVMVMLGMDGMVANGTNRVAILAQNLSATIEFFKKGFSDLKLSLSLSLCALPGTVLGAYLGTKLGGVWFNRILAGIMIAVLILMARKPKSDTVIDKSVTRGNVILAHGLMLAAGFYGGFIQAGVGFIFMAILHKVLRLDLVRVNMHKVFITGVYTLLALAIFASQNQVIWLAGVYLALGNAIGGWVGAHIAVEKGEKVIRVILNIVLIAMAIKLLLS